MATVVKNHGYPPSVLSMIRAPAVSTPKKPAPVAAKKAVAKKTMPTRSRARTTKRKTK